MMGTSELILSERETGVDVASIEDELRRLWSDDEQEPTDDASRHTIRACALNLIVVAEEESQSRQIADLAGEISEEHPSRIFLITADRRSGTPSLRGWVSARCSLRNDIGKQVCCEQISLVARGTDAAKIPSIVLALLVADVPTILLWKSRFDRSDGLLQSLLGVTDRLIIDSSEELSPGRALSDLHLLLIEQNLRTSVGDIAWARVTPWRSLVANAFQPEDKRRHLHTIDSVTIQYSVSDSPVHSGLSQSLLLAGWLSHRLGWIVIHPYSNSPAGIFRSKMLKGDQAVSISIEPSELHHTRAGGIESIRITSAGGLVLIMERTEHPGCVRQDWSLEGKSSVELSSLGRSRSESELIVQEIQFLQCDTNFRSSLGILTAMVKEAG